MSEQEILNAVQDIFRDNFDDDTLEITRSTCADDIEDWDSLEQINLLMIMQATDENFLLGPCLQHAYGCAYRESCGHCSVHQELHRVQEVLEQELSRYTMQELLNRS